MKNMPLFFILSLALTGCVKGFNYLESYPEQNMPLASAWTKSAAFTYIADEDKPYWQSPHETEARGGGDCEDIATALVYYLGPTASLIIIVSWASM